MLILMIDIVHISEYLRNLKNSAQISYILVSRPSLALQVQNLA